MSSRIWTAVLAGFAVFAACGGEAFVATDTPAGADGGSSSSGTAGADGVSSSSSGSSSTGSGATGSSGVGGSTGAGGESMGTGAGGETMGTGRAGDGTGGAGTGGEGGSRPLDGGAFAGAGGTGGFGGGGAGGSNAGGRGGGGNAGSGGNGGASGNSGTGGGAAVGGNAGVGGSGVTTPPVCTHVDLSGWVRTRYPTPSVPLSATMNDGAAAITVLRYSWVGWFEYDLDFPTAGNLRIKVRVSDDGWHEGGADALFNHFRVLVDGASRFDFDANGSPYDDGLRAVGDLRFHYVTGPAFSVSAGKHVVMIDNIADQWINGDDMNLNLASFDICREF